MASDCRAITANVAGGLRYTRSAFARHINRCMLDDLGYGLQLEAMAATAAVQGASS
jgi:hypothetical protein